MHRVMNRVWMVRALVIAAMLLPAGCRKQPATESTSGAGGETASGVPPSLEQMFDLKSHPHATILHPVDPRTMTESQIKFGIAPKRDPSVEYQPDIILMEQGDKAIKSIAGDGMTWTFDANAPQVSDFEEGKVVFATSRAVGRVLSIKRSGDTATVILGPVQITDVIRNGDFAMDQPLDMGNAITYVAPDYPEPEAVDAERHDDAEQHDVSRNQRPDHVDEQFILSRLTTGGKSTPYSMFRKFADGRRARYHRVGRRWVLDSLPTAPLAPYRSAGPQGPRLLRTGYIGMQTPSIPDVPNMPDMPGLPTVPIPHLPNMKPPPIIGKLADMEIPDGTASGILEKSGGHPAIGVKYSVHRNDLNLDASGVLHLEAANAHFWFHIKGAHVDDCGVGLTGAVSLEMHMLATSGESFNQNFHKTFRLPVDITIPLAGPVPFALTFSASFTVHTGFSAKKSVLRGDGRYSFGGGVNAGYWNGDWQASKASHVNAVTDLGRSIDGISVGVNMLSLAFSVRTMVGFGGFGFNAGVYANLIFDASMLRGTDIAKQCRQGTFGAQIDTGLGYQIPVVVERAINAFLSIFTSTRIESVKESKKGPSFPLFDPITTQVPTGCATPKGGG